MAKVEIDRSLLTNAERVEFDRRQQARKSAGTYWVSPALPADHQQRLRRLKHGYWVAAVVLGAAGALVGAAVGGSTGAWLGGVVTACLCGVILAVTFQTQAGFAVVRWADGYLDEIGYSDRSPKPKRDPSSERDDNSSNWRFPVTDGVYDPEEYQRRGGYQTKVTMEALGFTDYDSFRNNWLEAD